MAERGRFAPTPSGRMHLGNVFSALIAWLSVRAAHGELVVALGDLAADGEGHTRHGLEERPVLADDGAALGVGGRARGDARDDLEGPGVGAGVDREAVARHALKTRAETPWGYTIPEDVFRLYVLFPRVNNERLTFSHLAENRAIFAKGAIRAAEWMLGQKPGRYTMPEVLGL